MKKLAILLVLISLLAVPMAAQAQTTTTTAFQVVNLSDTANASIVAVFYNQDGTTAYTLNDTILAGKDNAYIMASMPAGTVPDAFNGSVVISSDQPIAAIVNQNSTGTSIYNGSYTGFSAGSTSFYLPVILNSFYGYHTEVSVQNAGTSAVDVTVTYSTAGCTDTKTSLAGGASVRFSNTSTCSGGLSANGSATISATGPVVAMVNQIAPSSPGPVVNMEQTYNGFSPSDGAATLYAPIALNAYYGYNSSFQVQNISGAAMDITATYSDGTVVTVASVANNMAATFLQDQESHASGWTGSAKITNSTSGNMVGIVNQASATMASSYNMFSAGAKNWALPSLLFSYYQFDSAFQVQNVSGAAVNVTVTYSDGTTASAAGIGDNQVVPFIQKNETHAAGWAGSARIAATGNIVVVVNQDSPTLVGGDYMYSYNGVPLP